MCKEHEHDGSPWEYVPSTHELICAIGGYLAVCLGGAIVLLICGYLLFGIDGLKYCTAIFLGKCALIY
jgi:hypothetical protein